MLQLPSSTSTDAAAATTSMGRFGQVGEVVERDVGISQTTLRSPRLPWSRWAGCRSSVTVIPRRLSGDRLGGRRARAGGVVRPAHVNGATTRSA
jgi:hypothetical protein